MSVLVPRSKIVDILKPKHVEQTPFGIHMPHQVHHTQHPQSHTSELLKKLAFLGEL